MTFTQGKDYPTIHISVFFFSPTVLNLVFFIFTDVIFLRIILTTFFIKLLLIKWQLNEY